MNSSRNQASSFSVNQRGCPLFGANGAEVSVFSTPRRAAGQNNDYRGRLGHCCGGARTDPCARDDRIRLLPRMLTCKPHAGKGMQNLKFGHFSSTEGLTDSRKTSYYMSRFMCRRSYVGMLSWLGQATRNSSELASERHCLRSCAVLTPETVPSGRSYSLSVYLNGQVTHVMAARACHVRVTIVHQPTCRLNRVLRDGAASGRAPAVQAADIIGWCGLLRVPALEGGVCYGFVY